MDISPSSTTLNDNTVEMNTDSRRLLQTTTTYDTVEPTSVPLRRQNSSTTADANAVRLTVLNTSITSRTASANKCIIILSTVLALPQIIAAIVILFLHIYTKRNNQEDCSRIELWIVMYTLYLVFSLLVEWIVYDFEIENVELAYFTANVRERYASGMLKLKYSFELLFLFWFLVGNMWVLSDSHHCQNNDDGLYILAFIMMIIAYVKVFLPCLVLAALIPIICFCLPCLIRFLRHYNPTSITGASQEKINELECTSYTSNSSINEPTCCICINDYSTQDQIRKLPCNHHFHAECVDEWLLMNATCPTCRLNINQDNIV